MTNDPIDLPPDGWVFIAMKAGPAQISSVKCLRRTVPVSMLSFGIQLRFDVIAGNSIVYFGHLQLEQQDRDLSLGESLSGHGRQIRAGVWLQDMFKNAERETRLRFGSRSPQLALHNAVPAQ